jgi:predicted nucleic acid-binding protein
VSAAQTRQFLDTNVLIRHFLGDHPVQSPRATAFVRGIERGDVEIHTADTVVFEVVFILERHYHRLKAEIRDALMGLIDLPNVLLSGKRHLHEVFDLYVNLNIPFADAYHVVQMRRLGLTEIVSFDRDYDRVPGITRIEP